MRGTRVGLALALLLTAGLAACGDKSDKTGQAATVPSTDAPPSVIGQAPPSSAPASPSAKPSASKKPAPKPSSTLKKQVAAGGDTGGGKPAAPGDGVPATAAGTFTVATGGTGIIGAGATLVRYRVEIENGIQWGANPVWTTASTAAEIERALGAQLGWTMSAEHPVTYPSNKLADASWSFQRVSGEDYSVRLRLATPGTVDKLCKAVGVNTQGIYSCRYGQTILLNLRRWLKGIDGAPGVDFHANTVNHEMGHFLGFDHMKCPGAGQPAPIMQTQTIALNGCTINSFPFTAEGTFVQGPWASS